MRKSIAVLAGLLLALAAHAQSYPHKPIKFVVPFPPGGNLDFVARSLQPKMQEVLGQPVLIDNKGGNAALAAIVAISALVVVIPIGAKSFAAS